MEKKTVHQYFLRYLLVFIVPIICLTTLFVYNNIVYSRKTIEDYNYSLLLQFENEMDLYLAKLENTAHHMSGNSELIQSNGSYQIAASTASGALTTYTESLPPGVTILFYPRYSNCIYLNGEYIPYFSFENSDAYNSALTFAGLFTEMNRILAPATLNIPEWVSDSVYSTAIMYPIPMLSSKPYGTVCFLLQKSFVNGLLEKFYADMDTSIFILDASHQILYSEDPSFTAAQLSGIIKNNRIGNFNYTFNGDKYIVIRDVSKSTGYHYLSVTKRRDFYAQNNIAVYLLIGLLILLTAFSVVMAFLFVRNFYRQVSVVENKNKLVRNELRTRNLLIHEMVINRLLNGTIQNGDDKSLSYSLSCGNIEFPYKYFTVAVCVLDNLQLSDEFYERILTATDSDLLPNSKCVSAKQAENNQIAVIMNSDKKEDIQMQFADALHSILDSTNVNRFIIGIGDIHQTPFEIAHSYVEAVVSINETMNRTKNGCYLFYVKSEESAGKEQGFVYPYVEHALIEQSIRTGSTSTAIQAIHTAFERIDMVSPSYIIQRCLHFDIINMLVKIASSLDMPLKSYEISQLSTWEDFGAMRRQIETIISELAEKSGEAIQKRRITTKRSLIGYVQHHYKDNNMSLDKLADEFGLSYTYISKIFKEETGQTFMQYITQLRFSYIKKELANTDRAIKDIINEAGYMDVANFMRKFKQNEGITPGQYREINQNKQQKG